MQHLLHLAASTGYSVADQSRFGSWKKGKAALFVVENRGSQLGVIVAIFGRQFRNAKTWFELRIKDMSLFRSCQA
jgi:hypothetical protein